MEVENFGLDGLKLIKPKRFSDTRGFFEETWNHQKYADHISSAQFVQDNHSQSSKGILRGLHYQLKNPQAKLVSVLNGAVFDVAVDLRVNSPTFGRWAGIELSAENGLQLFVPRGFAHGFLTLTDDVSFCYKCDAYYSPEDEYSVRWDSPKLSIDWPLEDKPQLSKKDAQAPVFDNVNHDLFYTSI